MGKVRSSGGAGGVGDLCNLEFCDSAMILDQDSGEWEKGWFIWYKRQKYKILLPETTYTDNSNAIISNTIFCAPYSKAAIFLKYTITGIYAANTKVYPAVSPTGDNFHRLLPATDYTVVGADWREVFIRDIVGEQFRVEVTNTGVGVGLLSKLQIAVVLSTG